MLDWLENAYNFTMIAVEGLRAWVSSEYRVARSLTHEIAFKFAELAGNGGVQFRVLNGSERVLAAGRAGEMVFLASRLRTFRPFQPGEEIIGSVTWSISERNGDIVDASVKNAWPHPWTYPISGSDGQGRPLSPDRREAIIDGFLSADIDVELTQMFADKYQNGVVDTLKERLVRLGYESP